MKISQSRYAQLLLLYVRPHWQQASLLFVLLFAGIALALINPQLLRIFIDAASSVATTGELLATASLFLVVAFGRQIISIIESYIAENIALKSTNTLRADLMLHCLRLDSSFHTTHAPGELIERIDGDVGSLSNFFSRLLIALIGNVLLLIGVLALLFFVDWRIGALLTVFALLAMFIVDRLRNIATPHWEKEREASAELFSFLEERFAGTEDVRSSGATTYMLRGLAERSRVKLHTFRKAIIINMSGWGTMIILTAIGTAISMAMSVYLYQSGTIDLATVLMIFFYTTLLNNPIEQIVNQLREMQQVSGSISRILTLLDTTRSILDGSGEPLATGALAVEFATVSFQYTEGVPVLRDINISLQPGSVMGLLGRTGSGKSTMTKLLTRLYDPSAGVICLNGFDIRTLRLDDLHERVGMVTQDVHILHTTVRNNLTLFDPTIPDTSIINALEVLGLDTWYRSLEKGLDTKLAPSGSGLSAGEAQLISFARVFLRDPGLVILDEASSRLDPATERVLEKAIDTLLTGRTGIIIAHRLATVQRADTIMILEDGECCEYGSRQVLARQPESRFAHLLRTGLEEVLA